MPFTAQVIKVFIASPGDVPEERQIVREVVTEWNNIHAEHRHQILHPVGWETHSTPALAGRAQAIINKQVLANCDLLIAVFWTRLGRPTGESVSGTAEEIDEHMKAGGRPAMLYFSTKPVAPDSIDPKQYESLRAFKARCYDRGLVEGYDSLDDFRGKLARHLAQTIIREFPIGVAEPDISTRPEPKQISVADSLSAEAVALLLSAAADDSDGSILLSRTFDGDQLTAGRKHLVPDQKPRTVARWLAALEQLNELGLVDGRGSRGEVFRVTDSGYEVASELQTRNG